MGKFKEIIKGMLRQLETNQKKANATAVWNSKDKNCDKEATVRVGAFFPRGTQHLAKLW